MKGLPLRQPWAQLMAIGAKTIETRSWATGYRGLVAIHAAQKFTAEMRERIEGEPFRSALAPCLAEWAARDFDRGCVVLVGELVDCREIIVSVHPPGSDPG